MVCHDGRQPLHWAANTGHVPIAEHLVGSGAEPTAWIESKGRQPLHEAASQGHVKIAAHLVTRGAEVAAQGAPHGPNAVALWTASEAS